MCISGGKSLKNVKALPNLTIMSFDALRGAFMTTMFLGGFMLHHIKMKS